MTNNVTHNSSFSATNNTSENIVNENCFLPARIKGV